MSAFHEIARSVAECLLNSMVEGVAIALFACVVLRVSGRRSSSTRFAVWFSVLIAIAALPWLHGFAFRAPLTRATPVAAFTLPGSWVWEIALGWVVIASVGVLRVILGLGHLRRLRAGSVAVDPATLDPRLQRTLQQFPTRTVTLAVSEQLQVPAAIGFFQPLIVLPEWSLREFSTDEVNSILTHELAHLRRWDDWTNLAQKLLRALFFFHPAIWWVESQVSLEREMACDDIVLSKSVSPRSYAECLVSVAEKSFMRRGLAMAQAAVNRMCDTTKRVAQILDRNRTGATSVWKPALVLMTVFSAVCLVVVSRAPEMIAFQDAVPKVVASVPAVSIPVIAAKWSEPVVSPALGSERANRKPTAVAANTKLTRRQLPGALASNPLDAKAAGDFETLLPVNKTELPQDAFTVQTLFVLIRGGEDGPIEGSWTLCVWRVTVRSSGDRAPKLARFPAKSI